MKHRIYVVGIGPGSLQGMTLQAREILDGCDCIVGYDTYINLIRHYFPGKEFVTTGMTKEVERCRMVRDRALQGQTVAIVSSGDAGIYGMAGIMHEVAAGEDIDIEVIPGVTAASAGAALLGAPLVADTCLISLSDLLTPWEKSPTASTAPLPVISSSACTTRPARSGPIIWKRPATSSCAISRPIRQPASSATSAAKAKKSLS